MNPHVEVEIARRYLVRNWQGTKGGGGNSWGIEQNQHDAKNCANVWNTIPDRILAASPHLQGYDVPGDEIDRLKAEGLTLLEALERLGM